MTAARAHPLLAIVGRPNVGKSTLFNRLVGGRPALVHDTPGLTRDRRYGELDYFGRKLRVVDTGGLDPEAAREVIGAGIHRQAGVAIGQADAVLFVVNAMAGITPIDAELAARLRKLDKPIFLAGNKIDSTKREVHLGELYRLGLGEVWGISAAHGRGVDELLEAVCDTLGVEPTIEPEEAPSPGEGGPLRVAFVGKPNAGKSSLVNRLIGEERALVHDQPGTTTDPVDTPFSYGGRDYVLVDTAGIRRKARVNVETEKISVSMALAQIGRADVAVMVVDGALGASEQDARLAGQIADSGSAVVVALNKVDLLTATGATKVLRERASDELHFLGWAPVVLISALRGDGVGDLMTAVDRVAEQHRRRIPTAELNRFYAEVCETHPPPIHRGKSVRIQFVTQAAIRPPSFVVMTNRPDGVSPSYRRYLINQLRARYGFEGTPLRLFVRGKPGKGKNKGKKRGARKSPSARSRGRRR